MLCVLLSCFLGLISLFLSRLSPLSSSLPFSFPLFFALLSLLYFLCYLQRTFICVIPYIFPQYLFLLFTFYFLLYITTLFDAYTRCIVNSSLHLELGALVLYSASYWIEALIRSFVVVVLQVVKTISLLYLILIIVTYYQLLRCPRNEQQDVTNGSRLDHVEKERKREKKVSILSCIKKISSRLSFLHSLKLKFIQV